MEKKRKGTIRHEEFKAQQDALYKKKLRKIKIQFLKSARKRSIVVKAHTRQHPTENKRVDVDSYKRKSVVKTYKNVGKNQTKTISSRKLPRLEFHILEHIKYVLQYNDNLTLKELEEAFLERGYKNISQEILSLKNKGLIDQKLELTVKGNQAFWHYAEKFEGKEFYDDLPDYYDYISEPPPVSYLNTQLINRDLDILSTIREQVNNPTPYFFPRMKYYNEGSKKDTDEYKILDIQSNLGDIDVKQVNERIEHYRKLGLIDKKEIKFTSSGEKDFKEWASKLD